MNTAIISNSRKIVSEMIHKIDNIDIDTEMYKKLYTFTLKSMYVYKRVDQTDMINSIEHNFRIPDLFEFDTNFSFCLRELNSCNFPVIQLYIMLQYSQKLNASKIEKVLQNFEIIFNDLQYLQKEIQIFESINDSLYLKYNKGEYDCVKQKITELKKNINSSFDKCLQYLSVLNVSL